MASVAFLRASLIVSIASITTAFTITTTTDEVTVRRGEQLQMSCDIGLEAGDTSSDIQEVRWFRGSNNMTLCGSLDVSRCNAGVFMCSNETTIDGRGTLYYSVTRGNTEASTTGTLTLTISSSMLEDNTTFLCSFLPQTQKSAEIHVTVNYLPSTTYPICAVSSIQSEALTYVLVCSSDKGQPVVSLEWTTLVDSSRMSLSNTTVVVGDQVENTLHLSPVGTVYDNSVFTCYMTSTAYPGVIRNCSIGPDIVFPSSIPKAISTSPEVVSRLQDMTISTGCASLTSTTSAPDSRIPGQGGNHTTAPLGQTQDSTATSGQSKNCLTPSVVSTLSTNDHAQPGSTYDTTPSPRFITSSPGTAISMPALSLSVTVIAAVGGAVGVIILILFIIIACLVASRRKTKRRGHREESALTYESQTAATDHPSNHAGDRYVNVPLETIVHSGPAAIPHHYHVPPSGAGGLLPEYAQATPRSHRKPSFEYTVPNQDNLPSQEDVPPPEYAEVTPRSQRQQPQHDYSVANPDNPPSQAGMLPPEYAEVKPLSQRRQPLPEYAMLDPDNPPLKIEDDGYSYAAVQEEKCRASPDGEEKAEQEWSSERPLDGKGEESQSGAASYPFGEYAEVGQDFKSDSPESECLDMGKSTGEISKGEEIQSGGASYPFGEYAEVGQDFKSDSPELECLDMGKITGEISKGEEVVPDFVENILYMDSSDEALIREQAFVNESLVTSKKKKKGKEKPRLDPF